jgi:hypothetical protein
VTTQVSRLLLTVFHVWIGDRIANNCYFFAVPTKGFFNKLFQTAGLAANLASVPNATIVYLISFYLHLTFSMI